MGSGTLPQITVCEQKMQVKDLSWKEASDSVFWPEDFQFSVFTSHLQNLKQSPKKSLYQEKHKQFKMGMFKIDG